MCKALIRFFLALVAILLGVVGVTILTFRQKALDANTYTSKLDEAKVYETAEQGIENYVKKNMSPESQQVMDFLFRSLNLKQLFQDGVDRTIVNFFAWVSGDAEQFVIYFPKTAILNSFNYDQLKSFISQQLDTEYNALPICTADQLNALGNTPADKFSLPPCRVAGSDQSFQTIKAQILQSVSDAFQKQNPIENALNQSQFAGLDEQTPVSSLLAKLPSDQAHTTDQNLQTVKAVFYLSGIIGIALIAAAIILALITSILGEFWIRSLIGSFSTIFIMIGFLVTAIGGVARFAPEVFFKLLPDSVLHPQTATEVQKFVDSLLTFIRLLIPSLFELTLIVGGAILIVSLILKIISFMFPKPHHEGTAPVIAPQPVYTAPVYDPAAPV